MTPLLIWYLILLKLMWVILYSFNYFENNNKDMLSSVWRPRVKSSMVVIITRLATIKCLFYMTKDLSLPLHWTRPSINKTCWDLQEAGTDYSSFRCICLQNKFFSVALVVCFPVSTMFGSFVSSVLFFACYIIELFLDCTQKCKNGCG